MILTLKQIYLTFTFGHFSLSGGTKCYHFCSSCGSQFIYKRVPSGASQGISTAQTLLGVGQSIGA